MREAAKLAVRPVRRKIWYNSRELFDLHRAESRPEKVKELREIGTAAVRVIAFLRHLPKVPLAWRG